MLKMIPAVLLFILQGCVEVVFIQPEESEFNGTPTKPGHAEPDSGSGMESENQVLILVDEGDELNNLEVDMGEIDLSLAQDFALPVDMAPPPIDMAPPPRDMAPPPVDMYREPDCSGCVDKYINCTLACNNHLAPETNGNGYRYGECGVDGSTNENYCCYCYEPLPFRACSRCLAGAPSCEVACQNAGFSDGICGAPESTEPSHCCNCF